METVQSMSSMMHVTIVCMCVCVSESIPDSMQTVFLFLWQGLGGSKAERRCTCGSCTSEELGRVSLPDIPESKAFKCSVPTHVKSCIDWPLYLHTHTTLILLYTVFDASTSPACVARGGECSIV